MTYSCFNEQKKKNESKYPKVYMAISLMGNEHRNILIARYFDLITEKEYADLHGMSNQKVYAMLRAAKKQFKNIYDAL